MKRVLLFVALLPLLSASCSAPSLADRFRGSDAAARELTRELVARGPDALPELQIALEDSEADVRYRARTAMARITGQWGSDGKVLWKRSVEAAQSTSLADGKPLLVLHLFGNFDEEFC